jgi:hypothetical protein
VRDWSDNPRTSPHSNRRCHPSFVLAPPAQERTLRLVCWIPNPARDGVCVWRLEPTLSPEMVEIAQINVHQGNTIALSKTLFAVERYLMDTNEKQIALSVLESLRADLMYAHLKNGSRILDVADLRQYIYALTGSPLEVTRIAKELG